MYNYIKKAGIEGLDDDEELQALIKQSTAPPRAYPRGATEPKSPLSPYIAHQNLKRTKTQRKAESKKRNYEKRLETHSNMTLYNSNISQYKSALDQIESPSASNAESD